MPEKTHKLGQQKFSNVAKLFWLYFVHLRQKARHQARNFVNFGPEPRSEKLGPTYNSDSKLHFG